MLSLLSQDFYHRCCRNFPDATIFSIILLPELLIFHRFPGELFFSFMFHGAFADTFINSNPNSQRTGNVETLELHRNIYRCCRNYPFFYRFPCELFFLSMFQIYSSFEKPTATSLGAKLPFSMSVTAGNQTSGGMMKSYTMRALNYYFITNTPRFDCQLLSVL